MSNNVDAVLKSISKLQTPKEIETEINSLDWSDTSCQTITDKLLLLNLRALTDKGFKAQASMLSQEYYNMEDLDGDGKIYGVDWVYENPPPMLKNIKVDPSENVEVRKFSVE